MTPAHRRSGPGEPGPESFERSRTLPHDQLPVLASRRYPPTTRYIDVACDKLARAATGLGIAADARAPMVALLRQLCTPWGDAPIGQPRYFSNVSLEGMPFELSYAWSGDRGYELRMSFETLGEPPDARSGLAACQAFTRRLAAAHGAAIERYLAIEDLVVSPRTVGMSPMAHGVAWRSGAARPEFKLYLNPNIHGFDEGLDRTTEAMRRLGVERAWQACRQHLDGLGGPAPRPVVIALDLTEANSSRIKVYLPHFEEDAATIDRQAALLHGRADDRLLRARRGPGLDLRALPEIPAQNPNCSASEPRGPPRPGDAAGAPSPPREP